MLLAAGRSPCLRNREFQGNVTGGRRVQGIELKNNVTDDSRVQGIESYKTLLLVAGRLPCSRNRQEFKEFIHSRSNLALTQSHGVLRIHSHTQ